MSAPSQPPAIEVSAVVVNYNGRELLRTCLESLRLAVADTEAASEIVVIENASTDGSREMLSDEFAEVRVVKVETNLGFAGAAQIASAEAAGEWLFFVNNDATVASTAISALLAEARRDPTVGALAAQMRFADRPDIVNSAGLQIDRLGTAIDVGVGLPVGGAADHRPRCSVRPPAPRSTAARCSSRSVASTPPSSCTSRTPMSPGARARAVAHAGAGRRRAAPAFASAGHGPISSTSSSDATACACWRRTPTGPARCATGP